MDPIKNWHAFIESRDPSVLDGILADDVCFHSPVVFGAQQGKRLTMGYLLAAVAVLGNESFRYVREIIGADDAVLEFIVVINEVEINGVDLIHWNSDGKIDDFKVMIRPLKAVNTVHQLMAEKLLSMK